MSINTSYRTPYFYYCTIGDIRNQGVPAVIDGGPTDEAIQNSIKKASSTINRITKQWFQPWVKRDRVDGNGTGYIWANSFIPIIDLFSVFTVSTDEDKYPLPEYSYKQRNDRFIGKFFVHDPIIFWEKTTTWLVGVQNYELFGAFGWVDRRVARGAVVKSKIVQSISIGDIEIEVENGSLFRKGNTIVIGDENTSQPFIINDIVGNLISIDPSLVDLPVSSDVRFYGDAPYEIREATLILVQNDKSLIGRSSPTAAANDFSSRIRSENIDNYSYSIGAGSTSREEELSSLKRGGTGNLEADVLIARFCKPNQVIFV